MEDNMNMLNFSSVNNTSEPASPQEEVSMLSFDSPKEQSSYIKVIGVGGGGSNAVNTMYTQGIKGVDFIVCNTDMKSLSNSPVPNKIILGELGAGNLPEVGRKAALEHKDDIKAAIANNTQMLFITAGMGGGTGTGAAPVIAEVAKQIELTDDMVKHILVVAVVTLPFSIEGSRRRKQAEAGIAELRKHVDSMLIISNDKLRAFGNLPLTQAFRTADNVLYTAVKGIAEIITVSAYVNIDFHDVNTVMQNSGTALMGAGCGHGENRAMDAIKEASTSVLLNDSDIRGAKNVLLYFSCSPEHEITMDEYSSVTNYITEITGELESDVIWGYGADESLTDELKITLIATGFGWQQDQKPNVFELPKSEPAPAPSPVPVEENREIHVEHRTEPTIQSAPYQQPVQQQPYQQPVQQQPYQQPVQQQPYQQPAQPAQQQPYQQPVQQQPYQQPQQPAQQPINRFNINGEKVEQPQYPQSNDNSYNQPSQQTYADGINIVHKDVCNPQQPVAEVKPVEQPKAIEQPKTIEQPKAVEQPKVVSSIETIATIETVRHIEPIVETSLAEQHEEVETEVDLLEEPVVEETPEPKTNFSQYFQGLHNTNNETAVDGQQKAKDRFERIKMLNEMLHNKPDGPSQVDNMHPYQVQPDEMNAANHSKADEASNLTIDCHGKMKTFNGFLFKNVD